MRPSLPTGRRLRRAWVLMLAARWPVVLRTTDGQTWKAVGLPGRGHPMAVEFIDLQKGWIVASLSAAEGRGVAILRTTDGGRTWRVTRNSSLVSPAEHHSLFFLDASHGWVVGWAHDARLSVVLRTDDGGVRWRQVPVTDKLVTLTSVAFADAERGWIYGYDNQHVGTPGAAFTTSDGGRTWQPVVADLAPHFGLFRLDSAHLWSLGEYAQMLRLSAEGTDWEPVGSSAKAPDLFSFATASVGWGIHYDRGEEGVAVGWQLLRTADGGSTWTDCRVDLPDEPIDLSCRTADSVVVVSLAGTIATVSTTADPGR